MDWVIDKDLITKRMEVDLSQLDVAVILGVSRPTYVKWEQDPLTMPIGKYEEMMYAIDRLKVLKGADKWLG